MRRNAPNHRCPECHRTFFSAGAVETHRAEEQGACLDRLPAIMRRRVLEYQKRFDISPPPLPAPEDDFDLLEGF